MSAIRKKRLPSTRIRQAPCLRYAQLPRMPTRSPPTSAALIFSMPSSPLTNSATRSQENQRRAHWRQYASPATRRWDEEGDEEEAGAC